MTENSDSGAEIRHYRQIASDIVESHFGKPPSRLVYKRSGLTNWVFAVNHVEGQFIVRISDDPEKIKIFRKELWATQKAREAGVPTSEVLAVGDEVVNEPYMITRRVTGSEATHHPKRNNVIHDMGEYAATINSIKTHGFGTNFEWSDEPKPTAKRTWAEYLEQEWRLDDRLSTLRAHDLITCEKEAELRQIIENSKDASTKPALNHGDLRLKNVIVDDDGEITAILDWEDCLSTIAPQWELSIALHDLSIDEKQIFIDGYGLDHDEIEAMAPLIKAFNIINYSGAVSRAAKEDDQKSLTQFKLRLSGSLDMYSLNS